MSDAAAAGTATTINLNKVIRGFAVLVSLLCVATGAVGIWRTVGSFNTFVVGGGDPSVTTQNRNSWFVLLLRFVVLLEVESDVRIRKSPFFILSEATFSTILSA